MVKIRAYALYDGYSYVICLTCENSFLCLLPIGYLYDFVICLFLLHQLRLYCCGYVSFFPRVLFFSPTPGPLLPFLEVRAAFLLVSVGCLYFFFCCFLVVVGQTRSRRGCTTTMHADWLLCLWFSSWFASIDCAGSVVWLFGAKS